MLIPNLNYIMDEEVSSDEPYDSDKVDSDIEAELYSSIHHEVLLTEPDNTLKLNNSLNFISVEENCDIIEKDFNSNSNLIMNFGKGSNGNQMVENQNDNLKRKSNIIANILGTIQVQNESPRKKQKTVNHQNRTKGSRSSSGNVTIELSDSDRDRDSDSDSSVILSEPDTSLLKLQTNVETFDVSSDSESSVTCLDDERRMSFDFNFSHNSNSNGNYKDLWKINDTDLYRTKRSSAGRYHENAVSQCTNCKAKGHVAKYCTEARVMKCFVCGGAHVALHCKNRICIKCLRYGHDSRRCSFPYNNLLCYICKMRGHAEKCCPDLWRRYHLTTSSGRIVRSQSHYQSSAIYCFNCGLQGHFGFDCKKIGKYRSYPTRPSVVSYEHPSVHGIIGHHVAENDQRVTNQPINPRVHFDEFQMESQNIPQMRDPCMLSLKKEQKQRRDPSMLSLQKEQKQRRDPSMLSLKDQKKQFYLARRKEMKLMRKKKGAIKADLRKVARAKQEAAVNSTLVSNRNFQRENVCINQEIDFPRTPKTNTSPPQCIDEMPKIKKNPRKRKISQARKERKKQKRALKFLKNCT